MTRGSNRRITSRNRAGTLDDSGGLSPLEAEEPQAKVAGDKRLTLLAAAPLSRNAAPGQSVPPALVARIRDIFIQASKDPELQRRLSENGTPIVSSTPEEMGRAMAAEWETMQVLAKTLNLRQP